ncbi:MAG: glycosyltransferase family 4 protein [Pseudomonadota bacterium]
MLFLPGTGDVFGTFRFWSAARADPSVPNLAYSSQIYHVGAKHKARMHVLSSVDLPEPEGIIYSHDGLEASFAMMPKPTGAGLRYHLSAIWFAFRVAFQAISRRADCVVLQSTMTHFWPLMLLNLVRVPVVFSLHNTLWPANFEVSRKDRILNALNARFFRKCARILCVSREIEDQVQAVMGSAGDNTRVHIPQYDPDWQHVWQDRRTDTPLRRLLYIGRIETNKGVFDLLEAFERIAADAPDLSLTFLGKGTADADLHTQIAKSAHAAQIRFPGAVPGAEVFAALQDHDLLVCPTTSRFAEGLAKTPIEAALCGVPSLLSNTVPVADMLGGAVAVVPADDPTALARKIQQLRSEPGTYNAMAAATRDVRDPFFDQTKGFAHLMEDALKPFLEA